MPVDRTLIHPCADLPDFLWRFSAGHFDGPYSDDPRVGEENPAWDDSDCRGDGFNRHPLLAAPGDFRSQGPVAMSGEIRDGKGYHPAATFTHGALCR